MPKKNIVLEIDMLHVATWHPAPEPSLSPPTQVHLRLFVSGDKDNMEFRVRLKSRRVVDSIIEALISHRDEVWPERPSQEQQSSQGAYHA